MIPLLFEVPIESLAFFPVPYFTIFAGLIRCSALAFVLGFRPIEYAYCLFFGALSFQVFFI